MISNKLFRNVDFFENYKKTEHDHSFVPTRRGNGEKYDRNHSKITDLIVSAGYEPNKPMPSNVDCDIPDKLINFILNIKYEEDIHW